MHQAMKGEPVTQSTEVSRQDLPFEFMLNALRLRDGFALADFVDRTGLAMTSIQKGLLDAEKKGLIGRDLNRVWPTDRGFDFLSDLQALFLSESV
jgi:oxygen-independent coproporphyrinogen-3 oxidase